MYDANSQAEVKSKLFIRPNYVGNELKAYTLTTQPNAILLDYQVIAHFDLSHNGKEIAEVALEFYNAECEWGAPINNPPSLN